MTGLNIIPGNRGFVRKGGREGGWLPDDRYQDPDDIVIAPFDFVLVSGAEAENALSDLKRQQPRMTPVIMGTPHEAGLLFERMHSRGGTPGDWLAQANDFDLSAWIAKRKSECAEYTAKYGSAWPRRGPWPQKVDQHDQLLVPNQIVKPDDSKPQVIIGLLPTADPTEAAAFLSFGGWNECPPPHVHVAFARLWHETHGAELQSNTYDIAEFRIDRPVRDRQEALRLALDQFYYCTESVPETLEAAAAGLIGAKVWCFWWD